MDNGHTGKLRFRTIWISDLHPGSSACQASRLLDFLRHTESEHLYLVGGIDDGWQLRRRSFWPQSHNDFVQKLPRKVRKGRSVLIALTALLVTWLLLAGPVILRLLGAST
jgi:hypothetical protein